MNIYLRTILAFCFSSMTFSFYNATAQQISFTKTYLNFGENQSFAFVELPDSGYIIVGSSRLTNTAPEYSLILRLNKYGDTVWTKNYNPLQSNSYGITKISDTSFLVSSGFYLLGGSAITATKINIYGDTIFRREYGYPNSGWAITIHKTFDGGYIMNNAVSSDYGFLKLDAAANVQWHTLQNMQIGCSEIKPDYNYEYIAVGGSFGSAPYDVVRLDSSGGIVWQYQYGNTSSLPGSEKYASDVAIMEDSNYLVSTNGPDWQLMKLNRNTGDTLWTRSIIDSALNHPAYDYTINCMNYGGNDSYILGNGRYFMLVDGNGDSIWKKANPFPYPFQANDVHKTLDGGFAFCGYMFKNTFPSYYAIGFVKFDSLGNTVITSLFNPENNFQSLTFYPNPASDEINLSPGIFANEKRLLFTLHDLQGRMILQEQYDVSKPIDVSSVPEGLYIATLKGKDKERRGKVLIQR